MSYMQADPYYQPEAFDLEIVASAGDGGGYDWDVFLVWGTTDPWKPGIYYWSGSGCSCYGPCDDVTSREDLTKANSLQEIIDAFDAWAVLPGVSPEGWMTYGNTTEAEALEFKTKVYNLKFF